MFTSRAILFTRAKRSKAKLRLAITGISGSGKTMSALLIAKGIGGKIALIDTEHESASLYHHVVNFDTVSLVSPFTPERYGDIIDIAQNEGYDTLIIDSISHEWEGSGGCLESNEELAKTKYKGNTWSAWNETTPRHRKLIEKILQCNMNIICTIRCKTETTQEKIDGKAKIVKQGLKPIQRDGIEYEFTTVLRLYVETHFAKVSKDRTNIFPEEYFKIDETIGIVLAQWLNEGEDDWEERKMKTNEEHLKAISEAKSIAELKGIYDTAISYCNFTGALMLKEKVIEAKDKRKEELSQPVASDK